ncbi:hypothetical protein RHMOL_Rhmol11G0043600 [Rhododendron molle]|uniref:Uncharacterized protein n=1 Tax=Rhododendron molle TaxID=49168 RepID=A0ACC0LNX8_RHOML|nr:hypothetical protein RHMOL_Rhmol11G0043600 [Rhododendron molle]
MILEQNLSHLSCFTVRRTSPNWNHPQREDQSPVVISKMVGQRNEIGEIRQTMVDLEDQLMQSITNIDGQLKLVVADVQKNMTMMFESIQEISDRLPAKSTPNPESSLARDTPIANPQVAELIAKINKLEESILRTERMGRGEIDMDHLSLFPNAKLPNKFKGMDFAKFDGTIDPKAHLLGYVGSLSM